MLMTTRLWINRYNKTMCVTFDLMPWWWRHQMEKFSALLAFCAVNSKFHAQRPVTRSFDVFFDLRLNQQMSKLECGTWYHHPRSLQCVLSRNLRMFKVATWHYRCRHNLKNNCIWDNLQYCLLVPRSSSKPVMLTFDLQSRKVLFIEIVFWHV